MIFSHLYRLLHNARRRSLLAGVTILGSALVNSPAADIPKYDLVVVEATPGGAAMAVRAAREGCKVLLTNHTDHLGGMMTNGLGVWDTLYEGARSPIFDELRKSIVDYYRDKYGEDSPQYKASLPGPRSLSSPRGYYEPHVAEMKIGEMVQREKNITVLRGFYPASAVVKDRLIRSVTLKQTHGTEKQQVEAKVFADASYEGDLLAVAGAPYRVGREARAEFDEPHAGVIFAAEIGKETPQAKFPKEAMEGRLNLRGFRATTGDILAGSTGAGDKNIQAFNFRLCLTGKPGNIVLPEKPANYDRELYIGKKAPGAGNGPNQKTSWNDGKLPGRNAKYPEGDWATRDAITREHTEYSLGWLYFMQNDESLPKETREQNRKVGLAKDEFADNGHVPYEMYVREARRLTGRSIFTQHDGVPAPGLARPPIHEDSIAITEWPLDSHDCTDRKGPAGGLDGKILLSEETRPGQVAYGTLLAPDIDNLLVPVCVSSTHIGWGTIRLEPTWMNIGEAAAFATSQALRDGRTPGTIDVQKLLRTLAQKRVMITFFNDVDLSASDPWIPAVQYFGTKGFFKNFDALPSELLTPGLAAKWSEMFSKLTKGATYDATAEARKIPDGATESDQAVSADEFAASLKKSLDASGRSALETASKTAIPNEASPITRAQACQLMFAALAAHSPTPAAR